jgi:hypothetical protein
MASIVSAGTTSATALNMSADTSGVLQLASNNGTVALTVTAAQRIGVGTTTPSTFFDINGTGSGSANNWIFLRSGNTGGFTFPGLAAGVAIGTNFSNGNSETNLVWGQSIGAQQYLSVSKWDGSSVVEQMRIDSSGSVCIGTTATLQSEKLSVIGGNGIFCRTQYSITSTATTIASGTGVLLLLRDNSNGSTAVVLYENANTPIIISQGGAARFVTSAPSGTQIQLQSRVGNVGVSALMASGQSTTLNVCVISCDDS